jgi:predicted nuclease of predicted toxin-antitoxin system
MDFKVDENLHETAAALLRQHGHNALTVFDQGLQGHADQDIATACKNEARVLISLDLDFADIRHYPPIDYAGIVVLRLANQARPHVLQVLARIVPLFDTEPLAGHLWIVDEHRVRVRT